MILGRRDLLLKGWKVGGALLAVAAGWTAYESLRPLARSGSGSRLDVGRPSRFDPGTATYINEGRLYIVNVDGDLLALFQKCPHLGCRVPFCESSGRFECPCHGSVFNLAGERIQGPTPRGMDRYPLEEDGGRLVVDTTSLAEGPDRSDPHQYDSDPRGPACIEGG
jgi:nitrite reductase/ring-hydroxylating ferredoxin subunit